MSYWMILVPIVSAAVGWIGMWMAGLILSKQILPAQKARLASQLAASMEAAFSVDQLQQRITDPQSINKVMPVVENHVDEFLRNKLKEKIPMIGMLIGDKTIATLKEIFLKEIEDLFPVVLSQFAGNLKGEFQVGKMIESKVNAIPNAEIERAISPVIKYFAVCGLIAGSVIGAINVLIYLFFA